ncbi:MAG: cache domain-containing protein, partial [Anaerolineales bacterium]|nr:cache domain-containing protein [Anaerolineales bacterium]
MPFEVWGATDTLAVGLPGRPLGYVLLLLYVIALGYALFRYRASLRQLTKRQWGWSVGLWVAALAASQLFPIRFVSDTQLAPLATAQNPVTTLVLLTAVPTIFAAATLNPIVALISGLFSGLGYSLGQTHQLFDIFHFGFAGLLAGIWLQQNYTGWVYRWLRNPIVSGGLSMALVSLFVGLGTFASSDAAIASNLAALDLGLSTTQANLLPLIAEGLFGGAVVALILRLAPDLHPASALRPSPESESLRRYLLNTFLRYAAVLTIAIVTLVFILTTYVSTRLVVNQMARDARTVSAEIPAFQARLQNLLLQYSSDPTLLGDDREASEKALRQLFRTSPMYRRILLVNADETITAYYPTDGEDISLTDLEQAAVASVFETSAPDITATQDQQDEHVLSFMVPVFDENERPIAVLVGRVPELSLESLIVGLQGTVGEGQGFVVDENSRIIAHPDSTRLHEIWYPPTNKASIGSTDAMKGVYYQGRQNDTNAREMVYYVSGENHPWTAVITVPYEVVLRLSLSIGIPLALVLAVVTAVFYASLHSFGNNLTQPIVDLVQASKTIAAGGNYNFA